MALLRAMKISAYALYKFEKREMNMRQMKIVLIVVSLLVVSLVATACGGGGGAVKPGDPARGKALYNQKTLGVKSAEGCVSCHNYDETKGDNKKAPFTKCTGTRAATRVPGLTAEEYIRESFLTANAYVVENYSNGDMYQNWAKDLSKQQIEDLAAYLLTETCSP